jgi:hypothetical protein
MRRHNFKKEGELMRRNLLVLVLGIFALSAKGEELSKTASTSSQNIGVGISFYGPVGLSLYGKLSNSNFLQGSLAWGRGGNVGATVDHAFSYQEAFSDAPILTPYWGLGVVSLFDRGHYWVSDKESNENSTTYIGGRIPLGVHFVIPRTPLQIGAEVAPTLLLTPVTYAFVQGGMNLRVLF